MGRSIAALVNTPANQGCVSGTMPLALYVTRAGTRRR